MNEYFNRIIQEPFALRLLIVFVGSIIILVVKNMIRSRLGKYMKDQNNAYRGKKAVSALSYLLIAILVSIIYWESLGALVVFFGFAGAGIAFALQEVIVSIAGWIAIMFNDIYKTGDRVMLGGIKGDVIDIGVLRTTIMEIGGWVQGDLYNGRIVRIANSFVFKEPVFNYSADFPFLWDEIIVPVRYGSDYTLARSILNDAARQVVGAYSREAEEVWAIMVRKYLIEHATTQPQVTIVANDNWVEYTLRYVVDYKKRVLVKDQLFSHILERVDQTEGRVKLASATFELMSTPTV